MTIEIPVWLLWYAAGFISAPVLGMVMFYLGFKS